MNKREKQVQKSLLNSELEVVKDLEKSYQQAVKDIDRVITSLLARKDTENLQSIIYQIKYQNALKTFRLKKKGSVCLQQIRL